MRILVIVPLLCAACSDNGAAGGVLGPLHPATIATADDMKHWTGTSAPAAYFGSLTPLMLANVSVNGVPTTCPVKTTSGTTTTYTGDCTDTNGNTWIGKATQTGDMNSGGTIDYAGFGYTGTNTCNGQMYATKLVFDGTIDQTLTGGTVGFTIDVSSASNGIDDTTCATLSGKTGTSYAGSTVRSGPDTNNDGQPDMQQWDGSGEIGNTLYGKVSAKTTAEVIDSQTCSHESLSGTTEVTAGSHVAVITYDGATSCDQEQTVTWTLDGVDQGTLTGVACNAGRGGGGSALIVALAVVVARRRRRA
jgi:hypothetical protein